MLATILVAGMVLLGGCWSPAAVDVPVAHVRQPSEDGATGEGATAEGATGEGATREGGAAEDAVPLEPMLNADPDGLDPYAAVTVTSPVTLVDDGGKPVGFLNKVGAAVEVRVEDGEVRRKVWCASCAPPTEGWVRTQDIALATVQ